MKKMKNVMAILLLAVMQMFISCEPTNTPTEEDNKPDSTTSFEELIVGRWECSKNEMKIWVSDELVTDDSIIFESGEHEWLIDANGFITTFDGGEAYEEKYTYRIDGDKLYYEPISEYNTNYYYIRKLTDTELILEWITVEEKVNKYNEKNYFTRVK